MPMVMDYNCKLCSQEILNKNMHCFGCKILLIKDFYVCVTCHLENKHHQFMIMSAGAIVADIAFNHTGHIQGSYSVLMF